MCIDVITHMKAVYRMKLHFMNSSLSGNISSAMYQKDPIFSEGSFTIKMLYTFRI